MLINYLKTIFT